MNEVKEEVKLNHLPAEHKEKDENENGCPTGTKGTLVVLRAIAVALAAYWVIYNFTQ